MQPVVWPVAAMGDSAHGVYRLEPWPLEMLTPLGPDALPQYDDFDQTPAFDPTEPEPVPEFDLDQTRGA